jgi:putative ABC transport system permease protein
VSGTVSFGAGFLDKGTIIVDTEDARLALDMFDASGEVLGFLNTGYFDAEITREVSDDFNTKYSDKEDIFSPVMISMRDKANLAKLIDISELMTSTILFVFILIMSIVLWNTGLISGLRRYGEIGVRLAIGESKGHVYRTMINESLAVGIAGSIAGTIVGLVIAYIMMPSTFRTRITAAAYFIGFVPGVFSTVLGTMLSGVGIYKRNTAQLFKELE